MVKVASILACILMISSIIPLGCAQPAAEPEIEVITVVSQTISAAEGGTITVTEEDSLSLAGLQLYIPPGALDTDQEITIGQAMDSDLRPLEEGHISLCYRISLTPSGLSFGSPATIKIPIGEAEMRAWGDLVSEETIILLKHDGVSDTWVQVPIDIDDTGTIIAEVTGFSKWEVAADRKKLVEKQVLIWMPQMGWTYLEDRLYRTSMFMADREMTFFDLIEARLLAEVIWQRLDEGDLYRVANLLKTAGSVLQKEALMTVLKAAAGVAINPIVTFAVIGAEITVRYLLDKWKENYLNEQVRRYLSWRGWFRDETGSWRYVQGRGINHDHLMTRSIMIDIHMWNIAGGFQAWQESDGTRHYDDVYRRAWLPAGVGRETHQELFNELGPAIVEVLSTADGEALKDEMALVRMLFKGEYPPPVLNVIAPDTAVTGEEVTLDARITVGNYRLTIRDGETEEVSDDIAWGWTQTVGPDVGLDRTRLKQSFTPTEPGEYVFVLRAWDTLLENSSVASVSIVVLGEQSEQYSLSISSTVGGSVTTPGEGSFAFEARTEVSLVATPANGYRFVRWTGDVDTIDDINAASTTITMNGDYSITANFEKLCVGAGVRSGSITAWPDKGYVIVSFDDHVGVVTDIRAYWSMCSFGGRTAWFYEISAYEEGSTSHRIAYATGVTHIAEITDASAFSYSDSYSVGCVGEGEFVLFHNTETGYYAALRVDRIYGPLGELLLDATWYVQTDGSPSFAGDSC